MRRIAITGATGMIGIQLIEYLLEQDMELIAFVHRNSGNRGKLPSSARLRIVELDLYEYAGYQVKELSADAMIHMGWQGTTGTARADRVLQQQNVQYSLDAVKLAKQLGCKRFIGIGSQAEYGRVEGVITEETICNPEHAYGIAKLQACCETKELCSLYGLEHIWVRIFSVYGPYNQPDSMIMQGIRNMLLGQDVSFTKGEQIWDYLYVKDAVRGLWMIANKGISGSIYCLGYGKAEPLCKYIESMYNRIIELNSNQASGKALIGAKPYSENQVMNLNVDISKLRNDTGFSPQYSFDEGIKETILWVKNQEEMYNG